MRPRVLGVARPDAMLALEKRRENQAHLSFAKVRYQGRNRNPYVLDFDPETETFTFVKEMEGEERDYAVEIEEFLVAEAPKTTTEIAEGIGAGRDKVDDVLKAHPKRFEKLTKEEAKAAERHPNAVLWRLASPQKQDKQDGHFQGVL